MYSDQILYILISFSVISITHCEISERDSTITTTTSSYNSTNSTDTIEASTYTTKYDNIDLDEILQNERLLKNYVKCLEFDGPCTPDAKTLRDILPDAINSDCVKCSEKQRIGSEKVTHFLIDNKPEMWIRLEQIYDPEGNYKKSYLESKSNKTTITMNESKME